MELYNENTIADFFGNKEVIEEKKASKAQLAARKAFGNKMKGKGKKGKKATHKGKCSKCGVCAEMFDGDIDKKYRAICECSKDVILKDALLFEAEEEAPAPAPVEGGAEEAPVADEAPAEGEEDDTDSDEEETDITEMDVKEIASAFDSEENIEKLCKLGEEIINTVKSSDFLDDEDKEKAIQKLAKATGADSQVKDEKEKETTSDEESAATTATGDEEATA